MVDMKNTSGFWQLKMNRQQLNTNQHRVFRCGTVMLKKFVWFIIGVYALPLLWVVCSLLVYGLSLILKAVFADSFQIVIFSEVLFCILSLIISVVIAVKAWMKNKMFFAGITLAILIFTALFIPFYAGVFNEALQRVTVSELPGINLISSNERGLFVKGEICGQSILCHIDTGCSKSFLAKATAERLSLALQPLGKIKMYSHGVLNRETFLCDLKSWQLDQSNMDVSKFLVMDMDVPVNDARAGISGNVDILIGTDFLQKHNAVIDYSRKVMVLR